MRQKPHQQRLPLLDGQAMTAAEFREYFARNESEQKIQRRIIDGLYRRGWMVVRINGVGRTDESGRYIPSYLIEGLGSKGHPDLVAYKSLNNIVCQSLLIEVKKKGGSLSPDQKKVRERFALNGIPIHRADSWEDVLTLVESL